MFLTANLLAVLPDALEFRSLTTAPDVEHCKWCKVKIVCTITMLVAVPAGAETKSRPVRQDLVHEYARKQIPLARAAHAATYACHEVTSDCDFSRDLRNTEGCRNAERTVKHLGVIVRKELAKIKPPVTMDERNAIAEER
jgi:hypothetical protein